MKLIAPITVTDAMLTSSLLENDKPAYSASTAYVLGDQVMYNHRIYEALKSTTGVTPGTTEEDWLDVRPTNKFAMFDEQVVTQSESADEIVVTVAPGARWNALAILNVEALTVSIVANDPVYGEIYNQTISTSRLPDSPDWYSYFFTSSERKELVLMDIPALTGTSVTVTITNTGGTAKCGMLAIGEYNYLGVSTYGVRISIIDFSRKERDEFGNVIRVERGYSRKMELSVEIPKEIFARVLNRLAAYRTTACIWIGSEYEETTIIYGWFRDFTLAIESYNHYTGELSIEGFL